MRGPVCFGRAAGKTWQIALASSATAAAKRNIGNKVETVMYKNVALYRMKYANKVCSFIFQLTNWQAAAANKAHMIR